VAGARCIAKILIWLVPIVFLETSIRRVALPMLSDWYTVPSPSSPSVMHHSTALAVGLVSLDRQLIVWRCASYLRWTSGVVRCCLRGITSSKAYYCARALDV